MVGLAAALLIGVVDTAMIAPLGTLPLAAAGITTAVLIVLISALWGVVTVISVQISQAEGAADTARTSRALRCGLWLCLLGGGAASLVMATLFPVLSLLGQPQEVRAILLPYWLSMAAWIVPFTLFFGIKALFDAIGRPWTGVALSYIGVVVNVPANYIFIHVLDMGLLGAGLASVLSQSLSLLASLGVLAYAPSLARFRARVVLTWRDIVRQARETWPLCLGYASEGGAYAMVGVMMGWLGAEALAAHQIVNALAALAYMIPLGVAGATSIRVGHAVGALHPLRLRPILKAACGIVTFWQVLMALLFIAGGRPLAAVLSDDPAVIELAATLFLVVGFLQVADGLQGTALGALRGMSDTAWPTLVTLTAYWPIALPACYFLGFWAGFGAVGIWLGYTLGLIVAATLLPLRFWRLTATRPVTPAPA
jgi:MATE family multidrug resistance protein